MPALLQEPEYLCMGNIPYRVIIHLMIKTSHHPFSNLIPCTELGDQSWPGQHDYSINEECRESAEEYLAGLSTKERLDMARDYKLLH